MPKNIVILSDGTGQAGGVRPDQRLSNIYKIYRAARTGPDSSIDPAHQIAFYDAGLGTDDDAGGGALAAVTYVRKVLAAVLGRGITRNVTDCYEAILNLYEPGDRIFLCGFSRGAYTVRSVAGVLGLCGVPTLGRNGLPMPRNRAETRSIADEAVRRVYEHGAGSPAERYAAERAEQARRFRLRYGSDQDGHANVDADFIGVFDTVASLGAKGLRRLLMAVALLAAAALAAWVVGYATHLLFGSEVGLGFRLALGGLAVLFLIASVRSSLKYIVNFPSRFSFRAHLAKWTMRNYDRGLSSRVSYARHAISIDETRADFPRVEWGFKKSVREPSAQGPEFLQQIWFAGNHSDIGGSYPEHESRLSDIALGWMVEQAQSVPFPLIVETSKLNLFPDSGGLQHCEVETMRDRWPSWLPFKISWPQKVRVEARGAPVHASVIDRLNLPAVWQWGTLSPYRPKQFEHDNRFSHLYENAAAEVAAADGHDAGPTRPAANPPEHL